LASNKDVVLGDRWGKGDGAFGNTGTVSSNFVNELCAFQVTGCGILESHNDSGVFLDVGYNSKADAFLFAKVDFF